MQLDNIAARVDRAFGDELPYLDRPLREPEHATLTGLLLESSYQLYLQDQVSRRIIRDYLVNAVVMGILAEEDMSGFDRHLATEEGRAVLSLHMLMCSVGDAGALADMASRTMLKPFKLPSPPPVSLVP